MTATSDSPHTNAIRPPESVLSPTSSMSIAAWRPISRNTAFSSTKAMVRQLIRSAIRDWAVCRTGALWPSSSPATTTAITPEASISSADDVGRERDHERDRGVHQRVGRVACAPWRPPRRTATPTSDPATRGDDEVEPDPEALIPDRRPAAIAVRSETSAVASLSSDSPSRIVTMRRGRPIRRPIAVAATASGGATTAPIANARRPADLRAGAACTSRARPRRS